MDSEVHLYNARNDAITHKVKIKYWWTCSSRPTG